MKFLPTLIVAFILFGLTSVSTSFTDNTGQSHPSNMPSDQNICSVYLRMSGLTADTLGVVPNGHVFVVTDLVVFGNQGHYIDVELYGDNNLKLKTIDQQGMVICNFTTGIPFFSCETIWIENAKNYPIHLTINGYYQ